MATRILSLVLLTLTLGACALEPMDPAEDPTGDQSSTLTSSPPSLQGPAELPTNPFGTQTAEGESPPVLPGENLRSGETPNKPQPDPWNPSVPTNTSTGTQSAK